MTLISGRVTKLGSVSVQPAGRIWVVQNEGAANEAEVSVNVDTAAGSARWDTAVQAFALSRPVEIDVLNTQGTQNNPFVADKIRMTQ